MPGLFLLCKVCFPVMRFQGRRKQIQLGGRAEKGGAMGISDLIPRGVGGMLPRKCLKYRTSETPFPEI